ncbi:MAG TPA: glycogen synthase GlgA [Verrucomicrobiae bacterium]|nr:glycogen synthase GlgA [Verrucomicrobiae bacterium]
MVSSEVAPWAKTGGLADVVGALPPALRSLGHDMAVVLPRYSGIELKTARRVWDHLFVHLGMDAFDCTVYRAAAEFPVYLVDCPELFDLDRKGLYGDNGLDYPDNHVRFAVFARAAIGVARNLFRTDIFHCHDWQAGLVPAYLRTTFATDPTFLGCRTIFTIHNLGYQGLFPKTALTEAALDTTLFSPEGMEFFGRVSYIKSGIAFSDALTTVSPTYSREIQTPELGFGLDGALRARANVLSGILNGVDYGEWSPEVDPLIAARYSAADLSGKQACKRGLIEEFGLPAEAMDRPLLGIVSRFTRQKGADILAEAAAEIIAGDVYLAALGSGEREYEDFFRRMQQEHPGRIAVRIGFDNGLAHRIEAGSDIFLMPSRYEPCGLNQMYSLRYGTPPVVHATGGLEDTIDGETGFKFREYSGQALVGAVHAALDAFGNQEGWVERMRRCMGKDFSWAASARAYSELYGKVVGR